MLHEILGASWVGAGLISLIALILLIFEGMYEDGLTTTPDWADDVKIALVALILLIVFSWLTFMTYCGVIFTVLP